MNSRFCPVNEARIIRQQSKRTAARAAFIAGVAAALTVSLAVSSCTPAAANQHTFSDGRNYPADWTDNPTAAIVYEPISSGAGHE